MCKTFLPAYNNAEIIKIECVFQSYDVKCTATFFSVHSVDTSFSCVRSRVCRPNRCICIAFKLIKFRPSVSAEISSGDIQGGPKSKLYICDHNSGKTHSIFIIIAFV